MRRGSLLPVLLLAALPLGAAPAAAQWIHLRRGPGLIRLESKGGLTEVTGRSEARTLALRFDERLQLSAAGWLFDPRIVTFSGSIMPTLGQHTAQLSDGMGRGQTMAYDVSTVLLPRKRVTITGRAGSTSGFTAAELGARSEWVGKTRSLGVSLRDRYFPIHLTWSTSDGTSTRRGTLGQAPLNLAQNVERFQAEVINPKLTLRYRRERDENQGYSSDPLRTTTTILVDHRLRWGRGSSLSTVYQLQDRVTTFGVRNHVWNETLGLRHTEKVSSRWEYRSRAWVADDSRFDSKTAAGSFIYEPTSFLTTDFGVRYRTAGSSSGSGESGLQILPGVRARGGLPFQGTGSLSLQGGVDRFTGKRASDDTWVDVLDEEHRVGTSLTFTLDAFRVDVASIRVFTEDLSFELVPGIDYLRLDLGGQAEIRILPTGRVQEGEIVKVSYRYLALEARSRSGAFVNLDGQASFRRFSVGAGYLQRSGGDLDDAALGDTGLRESYLSIGLSPWITPVGSLSLSVQTDIRSGRGVSTTRRELLANLALPRQLPVDLDLRSGFSRTQTDAPTRLDAFSSSLQAGWSPGGALRISGTTNYLLWDRDGEREQYLSTSATVTWRWRDVLVEARMEQSNRWAVSNTSGTRWGLSVTRRF